MIKRRLGVDAAKIPGRTGEFKVTADGEVVAERGGNWFTRSLGAGYPDLNSVVEQLEKKYRTGNMG